jgi:hypothetical protein
LTIARELGAGDREPRRDARLVASESGGAVSLPSRPAGRGRRLARYAADPALRDRFLKPADEYAARASAQETTKKTTKKTTPQFGKPVRSIGAMPDRVATSGVRCRFQTLE